MRRITIVSVTPIKAEADSRSYKIAASFSRFGYRSILVEGQKSDRLMDKRLPFELVTIAPAQSSATTALSGTDGRSWKIFIINCARKSLLSIRPKVLGQAAINFLRLWLFLYSSFRTNFLLPLKYIPAASLYYLHGFTLYPAVHILCKKYKALLIYDAHDFYPAERIREDTKNFGQRWIETFFQHVESRLVKVSCAVVTVNDSIAKLMRSTFKCSPRVLRNCHDNRLDEYVGPDLRQRLGLSQVDFIIVAIGNAKEGSAIKQALDAMLELPLNVHLVFLGNFYERIVNYIDKRGLQGRVHILPPVMPYEVVPLTRSADASIILYYPKDENYKYSLPNRFFQSIAAELPLLYPRLPEMMRITSKYNIGLPIDPPNPKSIVDAVKRLVEDAHLQSSLKNNLRVARKELSWEMEELHLKELLSRTLTDIALESS